MKIYHNKTKCPIQISYRQEPFKGGYGNFNYINFCFGSELTEREAKKGEYEILIENVKDFYDIIRSFKYTIDIK